jgi:transposase
MPRRDRITAILGFQNYEVTRFRRRHKREIELWLWPKNRAWRCPKCGRIFDSSYDRHLIRLRDLDLAKHRSYLWVPRIRINCPRCGVRRVRLEIARWRSRCTRRFEKWLFVLTGHMATSQVARLYGLSWWTVREAEVRYIEGLLRKRDLDGITDLGIDEVAAKKGHRYLTLVTDLQQRRVIWVGEGRSRATLKAFFRWFGKKRRRRLRRLVIDMHDPYEQEIRAQCPRVTIVYDHFHLSKPLHLAIDNIRRRLQSSLPPDGRRYLKGNRYLLLKGEENLTVNQRVRLKELLAVNEPLNAAYILKEDFRTLFDELDSKRARKALKEWKSRARESGFPELEAFVQMLNRRRYGILNFFRHRINNGLSEGYNNVVKTIKKMAYGFHDSDYFGLKILRKCGKIEGSDR